MRPRRVQMSHVGCMDYLEWKFLLMSTIHPLKCSMIIRIALKLIRGVNTLQCQGKVFLQLQNVCAHIPEATCVDFIIRGLGQLYLRNALDGVSRNWVKFVIMGIVLIPGGDSDESALSRMAVLVGEATGFPSRVFFLRIIRANSGDSSPVNDGA